MKTSLITAGCVTRHLLIGLLALLVVPLAGAEPGLQAKGALITVVAHGELQQPNDEVTVTLSLEEQDKDKASAASRVNQKTRQGIESVKRLDPQAILKTRGYYTYPIYNEEAQPKPTRARQIVSWRVGQYLDVTTANLAQLPKTVAAAQQNFGLNGVQFRLSNLAQKQADAKLIAVTYKNLLARVDAIAAALGRDRNVLTIESINFDGDDNPADGQNRVLAKTARFAALQEARPVEEPSLEPGESAISMRVIAKLRVN